MTGRDYRVLYKVQSGSSIREIMREVMPDGLKLVTLTGEDKEELLDKLGDADFVIAVKLDAEMIGVARRLKRRLQHRFSHGRVDAALKIT